MPPQVTPHDWTKLAPGWRYDPKAGVLLYTGEPGLGYDPSTYAIVFLGGNQAHTLNELHTWDDKAREQLARCRIETPHWYDAARLRLEKAGFKVEPKDGGLTATKPETSIHKGLTLNLPEADKPLRIDDVHAMNDAIAISTGGNGKGGAVTLGSLRARLNEAGYLPSETFSPAGDERLRW